MGKRLTACLAIALSVMLAFVTIPQLPMLRGGGVVQAFQVDLLTRMQTLELAVFGNVKADTSTVGYLTNNLGFSQISVTSAQIDTLGSTPLQILPAPGAGKIIVVDKILLAPLANVTTFGAGSAISLVYHGTSDVAATSSIPAANLTALANATTGYFLLGPLAATNGSTLTSDANLAIDMKAASTNFTGTGTAQVYIWYKTLTF